MTIRILLLLVLIPLFSNSQIYKGDQGSYEIQAYASIYPLNRYTVKALSTFHHDITGTSHLGLVFESFFLGDHPAWSWGVEAGYSFDNLGKHWEVQPMANMSMMHYRSTSNWRLQMGIDIAYRLNPWFKLHSSVVGGRENYHDIDKDVRENQYVVALGISYRPYFKRKGQ